MRLPLVIASLALALAPALALAQGPSPSFEPVAGLALSLDPPGPFALAPGETARATLSMQNDGNTSLALNVTAFAGGGGGRGSNFTGNFSGNFSRDGNRTFDANQTQPRGSNRTGGGGGFGGRGGGFGDITVTLDSATGTVDAGAVGTDGVTMTVASNATAGQRMLTILVREEGTNHTALLRAQIDISAPAATTTPAQDAGNAKKTVPSAALGASLALAAALALALPRRR